ncbi:Clp protease N-terminal domain-containing protein [Nocardia altamirensis]|uniref:Clp protease N-terminal domain-containing protein n=1 Tax=Nocardia altamirensis TaxID=472158 RepID=UPI00084040E4|nr:Clp protease N-terminal domain-containing protein [Nocardia altamirensis]
MTAADEIMKTPEYYAVLASAEQISRERGDGYVGVEHLVLAVLSDQDAIPTFELRHRMGVDPDELARRLALFLDSPVPAPGNHRVRFLDGTTAEYPTEEEAAK